MPIRSWQPLGLPVALFAQEAEDGNDQERADLERRYARRIRSAFRAVLAVVLPKNTTEQTITPELASARLSQAWPAVYDQIAAMLMESAILGAQYGYKYATGELQANEIEIVSSWDTVNETVFQWVTSGGGMVLGGGYATELTQQLLSTSDRQIRAAIGDWVRNGQPLPELVRTLESTTMSRRRAEIVATTEVTRAYAQGARIAWQEGGVIQTMRWQTANDELVCPICRPLNGLTADVLGGTFQVRNSEGFVIRTLSLPPAHPMCRCWVSPVATTAPSRRPASRKPRTPKTVRAPMPEPFKPIELPPAPPAPPPAAPVPIPEPVAPAPGRPWRASMTKAEADEWASGSAFQNEEFAHVTKGVDTERAIMRDGFDLGKKKFGRVWGDGVYVGLDDETAQMYRSWTGPGARKMAIKVRVENPFVIQQSAKSRFTQEYIVSRALDISEARARTMLQKQAITEILEGAGYDALRIEALSVEGAIGGNQMVVFNPKNVTVIKP